MRAQPILKKKNDAGTADRRVDRKIGCRTGLHEERAGRIYPHHLTLALELPGRHGTAGKSAAQARVGEQVERVLRPAVAVQLLRKSPSARIVNVSSGLGSLTHNSDPTSEFSQYRFLGYNASKAAVNMLTVQLAAELKEMGIKVNSADPGFTATDLNSHRGTQTIPEGASEAIRLALLPDDGPTGTYSGRKGIVPW